MPVTSSWRLSAAKKQRSSASIAKAPARYVSNRQIPKWPPSWWPRTTSRFRAASSASFVNTSAESSVRAPPPTTGSVSLDGFILPVVKIHRSPRHLSADKLLVPESSCVHQKGVYVILMKPVKRLDREEEAEVRLGGTCKTSEVANLPSKRQAILIVDPDAASRGLLEELVRSAGYDVAVSSSQAEGFKFVQDAGVDLLLLSADLADIQCCDALAEVKGNAATAGTRVILLIQGGGAERARGLELGADEVLTSPWEAAELLARVRVQLREKHAFDELLEKTRAADEGYEMAQTAFQALAVTEKMTRDAFSLGRALKIGVSALLAVAALISIIFLLFTRRADKENRRAYSVIAQLEHGVHTEEALVAEANRARAELQQS